MDIEKKKISTSIKAAFIGMCGVGVFVWYVSGYASAIDLMKIHLLESPIKIAKYDKRIGVQDVLNIKFEMGIKASEERGKRLEKRFDQLIEQLSRLQLVAKNETKNDLQKM